MSVGRLDIPCFLLAGLNLTLPVAVREKRFLAPLLVFILGILLPYGSGCSSAAWACPIRAVAAFPTGLARGRGVIATGDQGNKCFCGTKCRSASWAGGNMLDITIE